VFTNVTGLFTFSVIVASPLAYEPPATATFAVEFVSEMSWNTGFAAGKFDPAATNSLVPFTEMTADVGGAVGGAGGVFGGLVVVEPPPPEDDDEPPEEGFVTVGVEPGPPALKGSLLSKRENDCSWPTPAGARTASTSCVEALAVVVVVGVVGTVPPSVGATGSGVVVVEAGTGVAGDPVVPTAAGCGFEDDVLLPLSAIIVCTAYAIAAASNTPRPIAIFFCFCAFALAASATFLRATVFSFRAD
jgi:hypothetical protein